MLRFDEERNLLFAYKNDLGPVKLEQGPNKDYLAYRRYIDTQLEDDVRNIFLPALFRAFKIPIEENGKTYQLDIMPGKAGFRVNENPDNSYNNDDTDIEVNVRFSSIRNPHEAEQKKNINHNWMTILRIPKVTPDGYIIHDGKRYALIHMIEQQETISFNNDKAPTLKIKTAGGDIVLEKTTSDWTISLSSRKGSSGGRKRVPIFQVIAALDQITGSKYGTQLYYDFSNYTIRKVFKNQEDVKKKFIYLGGNRQNTSATDLFDIAGDINGIIEQKDEYGNVLNSYKREVYNVKNLRDELNTMLSLDRAIGKVLAEDVKSLVDGSYLATKGTELTQDIIQKFKKHRVYKIYVLNKPNVSGQYLHQDIFIDSLEKGTKIIPELVPFIPADETGMYLTRDISSEELPYAMIHRGTTISQGILDIAMSQGYSELSIGEKPPKGNDGLPGNKMIYFKDEIISNRHFLKKDVVEGSDSLEWVYADETGIYEQKEFLSVFDLQALLSLFAKLAVGEYSYIISNIDTGFRKRVVTMDKLMHKAFINAVSQGFKKSTQILSGKWASKAFFDAHEMRDRWYGFSVAFFKHMRDTSKSLEQLVADDLTNPIAFHSAVSKANIFVKDKNSVADEQRRIAIGHMGKLDTFETPQSAKMGTVLNFTQGCDIDEEGILRSSYFKVIKGSNTVLVDKSHPVLLTVQEEEKVRIGDISTCDLDAAGYVKNKDDLVLCRVPVVNNIEKSTFAYLPIKELDYVTSDPNQTLSMAAGNVLFLGSNDSARAIFGIAQAKQAKGLVDPDIPLCMTSANLIYPHLNQEFAYFAKDDGFVDFCGFQKRQLGEVRNREKNIGNILLDIQYDNLPPENISVPEFTATKYSVTLRKINYDVFTKGKDKNGVEVLRFKKGDCLITSNFVKNGILAMGKNALVGYVPTGFNYEDGNNASETFCNSLLSYRNNVEEFYSVCGSVATSCRFASTNRGKWISKENGDVAATVAVGSKLQKEKVSTRSLRPQHASGFLEEIKIIRERRKKGMGYITKGPRAEFVSVDPFINGDKTSNRHGNKGVMTKPYPTAFMPRLLNGMPLDIAYNPMGVISRMNIGQVKECNNSIPAKLFGYALVTDSFNGIYTHETKILLKFAYELANSEGDVTGIINKPEYSIIPGNLKKRAVDRIKYVRTWANTFDEKGEAYFMIPNNDFGITETKGLVGFNYVYKLVQESEKKLHVRGGMADGEPYAALSGAPTKGASNEGGQGYGTMEMDALCAYGASSIIHEAVNECGDNAVARVNLNISTYLPRNPETMLMYGDEGQRRSTTEFLYSLLALGVHAEPTGSEFFPLASDNCDYGILRLSSIKSYKYEGSSTKVGHEVQPKVEKGAGSLQDIVDEVLSGSDYKMEEYSDLID